MVEGMKIMVTSFKRSHDALLHSVPQPRSRPPPTHAAPETPGHSRARLGQSLLGSLLLSPVSWCTHASVCALQESVSQSCVSSGASIVGKWQTPPRGLMPYPGLLYPDALPLQQSTADPYLLRKPSNTVLSQSLWGLWGLVHTRYF